MQPTEFFYWIQGYFELSSDESPLTPEQVEVIKRHAQLVHATTKSAPSVSAVEHVLAGHSAAPGPVTDAIVLIVADVFEHVIDPAAGDAEQQAKLNKIHCGGLSPSQDPRPLIRC